MINMEKYLNFKEKNDENKIKEIAKEIKDGKVVVFPTETVYGIGTNGLDENAIEKLYKIKQRPKEKPITLLVSDFEMIDKVAREINEIEYKLIKKFMPGPLTIILMKKEFVSDILTAGSKFVGIRIPDNEIARKLIEYSGLPIATTSANLSGKVAKIDLEDIRIEFKDKIDYYIDGGTSKIGKGSTVVKVVENNIKILREGSITKKQLEDTLK